MKYGRRDKHGGQKLAEQESEAKLLGKADGGRIRGRFYTRFLVAFFPRTHFSSFVEGLGGEL